jgi:L-lactate dehydrogenase complex protein LldE
MANAGSAADAAPLARRFLDVFSGADAVVCPSGSCTAMVRNHYGALVGTDPRYAAVRGKTYELCEFLFDVLGAKPRGRFPYKVGLHQSCHGLRELRLGAGSERRIAPFNKVRSLLEGLDGITLVDLARADECCGFGGTFALSEEAVSCAMGRDRIQDHERAGAEVIAGGDVSCLMHLEGLLRRDGKPLRTMHVAEVLAEAERVYAASGATVAAVSGASEVAASGASETASSGASEPAASGASKAGEVQ